MPKYVICNGDVDADDDDMQVYRSYFAFRADDDRQAQQLWAMLEYGDSYCLIRVLDWEQHDGSTLGSSDAANSLVGDERKNNSSFSDTLNKHSGFLREAIDKAAVEIVAKVTEGMLQEKQHGSSIDGSFVGRVPLSPPPHEYPTAEWCQDWDGNWKWMLPLPTSEKDLSSAKTQYETDKQSGYDLLGTKLKGDEGEPF